MSQLIELNSAKHGDLKVMESSSLDFAARQHALPVRAIEVGKAISSFPVFISKNEETGNATLLVMTGLEVGRNVFVSDGGWSATYVPAVLQTYPLFLMQSPRDAGKTLVGFDEDSGAFSKEQGEALFTEEGTGTTYLQNITTQLQTDLQNDIQTALFTKHLGELSLIKSVNVNVHYVDDHVQTLTGLHTVDESKLQLLEPDVLSDMHRSGYLMLLNGMMMSIFQLNLLIKNHNRQDDVTKVTQVKIETVEEQA